MTASNSSHDEHHNFFYQMGSGLFPFYCLAFGLLTDTVARTINQQAMSTVILLVMGFLVPQSAYYFIAELKGEVEAFMKHYTWIELDTHVIMFALLPILIFESAFSIEAHEFGKHFLEIIILAGPCFLLGFVLLALWMLIYVKVCLDLKYWTFKLCLLYSATISATDPVAVVMLLSSLGVPHRLRLLIEGESLLNDGVAIILYQIMISFVKEEINPLANADFAPITEIFTRIVSVLGSILIGVLTGRLAGWFLGKSKDSLRERAVIMLFVYVTYIACESTKGSGVLGVVTHALILSSQKERMSSKSSEDNRKMWQFLAYWANWILFLLTGLMASHTLHKSTEQNTHSIQVLFGVSLWAYVGAFVCRGASLVTYASITIGLEKMSPHWLLPWSYTSVLLWGGLRGSIALLLAMQLANDKLPPEVSPPALASVTLTVLISNVWHTLTAKTVCDDLNLTQISKAEAMRVRKFFLELNKRTKPMLRSYPIVDNYFWSEANWETVEGLCTFEEEKAEEQHKKDEHSRKIERTHKSHKTDVETDINSRLIVMNVMSADVRAMGEREVLSTLSVQYILNAINEAIDHHRSLDVTLLYKQLQPYAFVRAISARLKSILDSVENLCNACIPVKIAFIGNNVKLMSDWWQVLWHMVVFGHCVLILLMLKFKTTNGYSYEEKFQYLLYLLLMLAILLAIEIVIRIWLAIGKFREFICNRTFWRLYDFLRIVSYVSVAACNGVILKHCFSNLTTNCGAAKETPGNVDTFALNNSFSEETLDSRTFSTSIGSIPDKCGYTNCSSLDFIPPMHSVSYVPLFSLMYALFWLFYLLPRVFITELHEYTVKADNLTLESLHGIVLLAEQMAPRLNTENKLILSERLRPKLEEENLKMKKEAESNLIDLLNVQTANSKRIAAIKTRHVARLVLNEMLTEIEKKLKRGEIGDHEFHELETTLIDRIHLTQQILTSKQEDVSFESRLKVIPWIRSSKERKKMIQFIESNAKLKKYPKGHRLIKEGDDVDGVYFLMSGVCKFYKNVNGPEKGNLLYSGRFVGEKAFLESKSKREKRAGNVVAATEMSAYFLSSEHAMKILEIDPLVVGKFEEADMDMRCKDFLRGLHPYSMLTVSALDALIQNKRKIIDREDVLPRIDKGASYVFIKGQFEFTKDEKLEKVDIGFVCKKVDGPLKESVKVFGSKEKRCFVMELVDNHEIQAEDDSDKSNYSVQNESKSFATAESQSSVKKATKSVVQKESNSLVQKESKSVKDGRGSTVASLKSNKS